MDRWKSRGRKSQRREKKKREDQRRERVRRKKMQVREKVEKSRFTVFFQWLVAPEGRKVGSLKRRVRSHLARWEIKIARRCGVKHMSKSKCTKHTSSGPLLEVEMSKKCTPLWREAHFQVNMLKAPLLKVQMWFCVAGARDSASCQKWVKTWGFCSSFRSNGRRGTSEEDLERCISRGRRSTKRHFHKRHFHKRC